MNTATVTLSDTSQKFKNFNLKNSADENLASTEAKEKRRSSHSTALERAAALDISKTLLSSFSPEMIELCESYHCTKLTTQIKALAKLSEGRAGTRPIYVSKYGKNLSGFEFNNQSPYTKIFKAKYHIKQGSRRDQVIIHFPSFIPNKTFKRSEEATNFKISARLVALSDFRYDQSQEIYKPANSSVHGEFSSYETGMLPLLKMPLDPKTCQLSLNQRALPENVSLFLVMAVSFYTYDHGRFIHLRKEGGMQIKQVF